jgi:hypothetical protein
MYQMSLGTVEKKLDLVYVDFLQKQEVQAFLFNYFVKSAKSTFPEEIFLFLEKIQRGEFKEAETIINILSSQLERMEKSQLPFPQEYTTGQLATFFGVSIQTIHKWIEQNRFLGVEKGKKYKQLRVSENVLWVSPSGQKIYIRDIANAHYQNSKEEEFSDEERIIKDIRYDLERLKLKYGNSYEDFKSRMEAKEMLTDEENNDLDDWEFLLRKLAMYETI